MIARTQLRFWLVAIALLLVTLYILRGILLPFVAGMAIAYFLDPICDRLERAGLSRNWATVLVSAGVVVVLVVAILVLVPMLQRQVVEFARQLPTYVDGLMNHTVPQLQSLAARFGLGNFSSLRSDVSAQTGSIVAWIGAVLVRLFTSGVALANLLSLLFITPVVAFYLLRDWDRLVVHVDSLLPRGSADAIRAQLREIDRSLAGFARGQATVCLLLAIFYAAGLSLIGVDFGLAIGMGIGLLSFIPYVGSITGFVTALIIAIAQFDSWTPVGLVVGLFVLGQVLEGYLLTPRLVGNRVGLHPVWIIFALLAGGALFGFVGLLLAVPAAAVIGVLSRFAAGRYRDSHYFRGDPPWPNFPST